MAWPAVILLLALTGCGYFEKHEAKQHNEETSSLERKHYEIYSEVEAQLDPVTGWPGLNDCDLTLWAGISCQLGMRTNILYAEYSPGEIHRRPYRACYTDQDMGSKTTISRDMLTGYMGCLIYKKDLPALKRLAEYGERNNWIMGRPEWYVSRVYLGTNLTGLLGRAIHKISGGSDSRSYRHIPTSHLPVTEDYARHIQVQEILLQDAVSEIKTVSINGEMLQRLKDNARAEPEDPLFAAALGRFTGDQSHTLALLMRDEMPCPTYARGEKPELYCKLVWLQAAQIVLESGQ
jgi:hypothetical protein